MYLCTKGNDPYSPHQIDEFIVRLLSIAIWDIQPGRNHAKVSINCDIRSYYWHHLWGLLYINESHGDHFPRFERFSYLLFPFLLRSDVLYFKENKT